MCALSGTLRVDLQALQDNYRYLHGLSKASCETAAAVKANAYGLGIARVVPALRDAGARQFFVATINEGVAVRQVEKQADVYILNGFVASAHEAYIEHNLTPVLNSLHEIKCYSALSVRRSCIMPALLHFDTGMNRLGISADEMAFIAQNRDVLTGIDVQYIMSHFCSSEEVGNALNKTQYQRFQVIARHFPDTKKSLCNSGGIFLSPEYHMDLTRPGVALYGGQPSNGGGGNPMRSVVSLDVPVLQVHSVSAGQTCGYNGTYTFEDDGHVAILSVGYADGLHRALSNQATVYWRGHALPVRGRVSMDLLICDVSAVPEQDFPKPEDNVEILGVHQCIDDLAKAAGTISYEIFTSLGQRYNHIYT